MKDEFLLLETICSTLHIGKTTAYKMIQSGHLPAKKIGGKWQIRICDFEHYLATSCQTTEKHT